MAKLASDQAPRDPDDLSGAWFGQYSYPDGSAAVSFIATFHDDSGMISGRITEPNTFGLPTAQRLSAAVSGHHANGQVDFAKIYDGTGGVGHVIEYSGDLSRDGKMIAGTWSGGGWSSSFFMTRELPANDELSEPRQVDIPEPV